MLQGDDIAQLRLELGADLAAPFSNFGTWVSAYAPGIDVLTASAAGEYRWVNGTSYSCALAAGVAALMLARNPTLTPAQIKAILENTGMPVLPNGIGATPVLSNVLNAYEAVRQASGQ